MVLTANMAATMTTLPVLVVLLMMLVLEDDTGSASASASAAVATCSGVERANREATMMAVMMGKGQVVVHVFVEHDVEIVHSTT
jgi:hypothetical protein